MPRKSIYDYYNVAIPRDAIPEEDKDHEELFRLAFLEAERRSRIYAMPCEWTAKLRDDFDSAYFHVIVRRKRRQHKRPHFHMLVGMPGYLPDTNYTCRSRSEAKGLALCQARNFRNTYWDCDNDHPYYKVEGNMHDGYDVYRRNALHPQEVYTTICVTECFVEDCLKELEE